MEQNELRTYQRRSVTRESGYHTCDETTGGECIVIRAQRFQSQNNIETFSFYKKNSFYYTFLIKKKHMPISIY